MVSGNVFRGGVQVILEAVIDHAFGSSGVDACACDFSAAYRWLLRLCTASRDLLGKSLRSIRWYTAEGCLRLPCGAYFAHTGNSVGRRLL